jgi:hypothetical protein
MTSERRHQLGVTLAAGFAGLAINLMPLGIASLIWPGRIVALPVAIVFGPWFGAIAAFIAAAPYFAFPPILVFVMLVEAVIVGTFGRRGKSAILAGAIVWAGVRIRRCPRGTAGVAANADRNVGRRARRFLQ